MNNDEIIVRVEEFDNSSKQEKIKFFEWVKNLKEEYCILAEENKVLREGYQEARSMKE